MLPILGSMANPGSAPPRPGNRSGAAPAARAEAGPEARPVGRPRDSALDTAILDATRELLAESGYSGLTMEAVAGRAGTTKPAIRRRWPSRQRLVVAALTESMGNAPTPDTGCTHCDLILGIETLSRAFGGDFGRRTLPALVADLADDPELDRIFAETFFHPRRASTEAALRRGVERGDIRPDADLDLLLDLLGATTYHRVLFGHAPITPELAHDVVVTVLDGASTPRWRKHYRERHDG